MVIWKEACRAYEVSEMQMGDMVVMTLTDTCKLRKGLATKFFDVIDQTDMETSRAYDTVLDF